MEPSKTSDFKTNVADLTKIPPNEFEKYFQDWMERDDVARSLQAKLRCDLIKNFNKTNLGKHILSHTMTCSGGNSTLRLTLSPLVLALNTLVAEFLYAQNCHFSLSVFCTEIPFRNTLPDFESMRRFRFNNEEISEIWQAVTGSKPSESDLNRNIIQSYKENTNTSLLLLVIKCLLRKDPLELLKRNAEVQTDIHLKANKSVSAQVLEHDTKTSSRATVKDDNLHYINKYLLTLSEKVLEMTKEFEQFAKQSREARPRSQRSARSREYYMLNRSLERITNNMKTIAQAKRKNKHLSIIVQSIDNLTQQFGECAHNFENVTKVLRSKHDAVVLENSRPAKVKLRDQQTDTECREKSYADWIYEMRTTENGQKFLNRIEISLRKALTKHREQLQNATEIKIKQIKSLMRRHYKQKLSKCLLQNPTQSSQDARKRNESVEKKLEQFENKQLELLQKLQASSLELKEAQLKQKERLKVAGEEHVRQNTDKIVREKFFREAGFYDHANTYDLQKSPGTEKAHIRGSLKDNTNDCKKMETIVVSKDQDEIHDVIQITSEDDRSMDHIIQDAKLRIKQLEIESSQLEQNFLAYLERRKRAQELDTNNKIIPEICSDLKDIFQITNARLTLECGKPEIQEEQQNEEMDEQFHRLKEKLHPIDELINTKEKSAKSESSASSLEIKNAILEAKLKFFEHENTIRKCREQGEDIRCGSNLQKRLQSLSDIQELSDCCHQHFGSFISQTNVHFATETDDADKLELDNGLNLSKKNSAENIAEQEKDRSKSQTVEVPVSGGVRRELFPKDEGQSERDVFDINFSFQNHNSKRERNYRRASKGTDTTSKLIKESMAKMQQLFEQHPKSQDTLKEVVNEIEQERILQGETIKSATQMSFRPSEVLEKSLTATTTTTTTSTTTKTDEEIELKNEHRILASLSSVNRISNTSMPSLLYSSSESEDSVDSKQQDNEMAPATMKQIDGSCPVVGISSQIELHQNLMDMNESSESSELVFPTSLNNNIEENKDNFQLELGELNDSPKLSSSNISSQGDDKEVVDLFMESNQAYPTIDNKPNENVSLRSSSDFEISTGHLNKDSKNLADNSDSDFWT